MLCRVDVGQLFQRALGDLALVGGAQIEGLAPRLRQAPHLGHASGHQRLVAAEVIAKQAVLAPAQEGARVLARAAPAEVADRVPQPR